MKRSVEILRILEFFKVLSSPLSILTNHQTLLRESIVVSLIEMHPNDKYFTDVLSTSDSVIAQEREAIIFDKVFTDHRLVHNYI